MRKWFLLLGLLVLIPLVVFYGLAAYYDREQLRTELSEGLTRALDRPVTLDSVSFRLFPRPHLEIERLRVQLEETRPPLTLGSVSIGLDPLALLKGKWTIPALRLSDVILTPEDYAALTALLKPTSESSSANTAALLPVKLRRIELRRITWVEDQTDFYGPVNADINLAADLSPARAQVTTLDESLEVQFAWQGALILFEVQAQAWQPPNDRLPPVEQARLQGKLFGSRLVVDRGTVRWKGADLSLSEGSLDWNEALKLKAGVGVRRLALPVVLAQWDMSSVPGEFRNGTCLLNAQGETWAELIHGLSMDCKTDYMQAGRSAPMDIATTAVDGMRRFSLRATDFQLPVTPALQFDQLRLAVVLNGQKARVERFASVAYGGEVAAVGAIDWSDGWVVSFVADAKGVDLEPLLLAFGNSSLSGNFNGRCQGEMKAGNVTGILASRKVDCEVLIRDGVVKNADLESAAKVVKKQDEAKGNTPFELCQTEVQLRPEQTHLRNIAIRSTALEGAGNISISQDSIIDGEIKVAFKKTAGVIGVPLRVSGPLDDPKIMPTRSALAGGAAGTFVLGPGLGTAIGVKVGEVFGKIGDLFKGEEREGGVPAGVEARGIPSVD